MTLLLIIVAVVAVGVLVWYLMTKTGKGPKLPTKPMGPSQTPPPPPAPPEM